MERGRPAVAADADRLVELGDEALAEITARRGGPQLVRSVLAGRSVPEVVAAALRDPSAHPVAGELDGVVLGVGLVRAATAAGVATGVVDVLYVEPEARGIGLGEAMLEAMAHWAASQGCSALDATALPGSRDAKSFFETHGLIARALLMHRSIDPSPDPGRAG